MKWLPYHKFEIISPLKASAALAAIAAKTEPEKVFRWRWPSSDNDQRFEGAVQGDTFHLRRIIGYRNSFLPVIDGIVHREARGSRIVITMRPFIFVIIFVAVWAVCASSFALAGSMWPIGLGLLLFVYAMTMGGFWFEASKQERTLREIFQAS